MYQRNKDFRDRRKQQLPFNHNERRRYSGSNEQTERPSEQTDRDRSQTAPDQLELQTPSDSSNQEIPPSV